MGKSTEPLKTRQYLTAETLTVVRPNPIQGCHIPRNASHFFVSPTAIPVNRCLTEWILSVKHRLLTDKLLILNNLSVKPHLFTNKLNVPDLVDSIMEIITDRVDCRLFSDTIVSERHDQREKPNNLQLA